MTTKVYNAKIEQMKEKTIKNSKVAVKRKDRLKMQKIIDDGEMYIIEAKKVGFPIKRVYCILDADTELPRGYHAHRATDQAVFCLKGGLRVTLDDGKTKTRVILDPSKPGRGVLQSKMVWVEMDRFKPGTILLILASEDYDPGDYIRSYHQFIKEVKNPKRD